MRQNSRIPFALPVLCLVLASATLVNAQSSNKAGKTQINTQTRTQIQIKTQTGAKQIPPKTGTGKDNAGAPAGNPRNPAIRQAANIDPAAAPPVNPDLEAILEKWAAQSKQIKSLHGNQTRQEFNKVFAEEKRTKGKFFLQTPDKGRIDFGAEKIGDKEVSGRKDPEGKPYKLDTGFSERWICNGTEILVINDQEKTIQRQEIPEEQRGKNIVHSPLPFLFGMTVEEAKERFQMTLKHDSATQATIDAIPLTDKDRQNFQAARITLNKKTWLPNKVQMIDIGNVEVVYTFDDVVINDAGFGTRIQNMIKGDPYHPKLLGYKEVLPPDNDEKEDRVKPEQPIKAPKANIAQRKTNPTLNIPGPSPGGRTTGSSQKK